jgi:hypothetical protein
MMLMLFFFVSTFAGEEIKYTSVTELIKNYQTEDMEVYDIVLLLSFILLY